jgi:hypothetical protein
MQDRRRYKRFNADIMEINGNMILARYVKILNISAGGVSLKADRRLNIGSEYTLRIGCQGKDFIVKGVVVWAKIDQITDAAGGGPFSIYIAGMRFANESDEKIGEIIHCIEDDKQELYAETVEFALGGLNIQVSVRPENAGNTSPEIVERPKVMNLGENCMRIESRDALDVGSTLPMEMTLHGDKSVKFAGRVTSCIFSPGKEEREHYEIGIELLDIPDEDRKTLTEFIGILEYIDKSSLSILPQGYLQEPVCKSQSRFAASLAG